jgi:mannose-1-phosphate guanylyltransferase
VDHFILNPKDFNMTLKQGLDHYTANPAALTLLCTDYKDFNSNDGYCLADDTGSIQSFLEKPTKAALSKHSNGLKIYRSPLIYIATRNTMSAALDEISAEWTEDAKKILAENNSSRKNDFLGLPFIDISSTIFQQSKAMRVIQILYEYIDVGRFEEVYELNKKDANGNAVLGNVIFGAECHNNLVINKTDAPLVVIDKDDTVIVHTPAGSLVSSFTHASMIGEIYKSQIHRP